MHNYVAPLQRLGAQTLWRATTEALHNMNTHRHTHTTIAAYAPASSDAAARSGASKRDEQLPCKYTTQGRLASIFTGRMLISRIDIRETDLNCDTVS